MSFQMVSQVLACSKSEGSARLLLVAIAHHANPITGLAWPSLQTLAHETRRSERYLRELLVHLERLGELHITRGYGRGHSHQYRILLDQEPPQKSAGQDAPLPDGNARDWPQKSAVQGTEKRGPDRAEGNTLERKILERAAGAIDHGKTPDAEAWVMLNRTYGLHLVCGANHQPGTPCYQPPAKPAPG